MQLAYQSACQLNHDCIGLGHIFIGLATNDSSNAGQILKHLCGEPSSVLERAYCHLSPHATSPLPGKRSFTREARRVIDFAVTESSCLGHQRVGTEHILLGMLRLHDGFVEDVLKSCNLTHERVQRAVAINISNVESPRPAVHAETEIDAFRLALSQLAASSASRQEICEFVVPGLQRCLAAYGVTLWQCWRRRIWSRRVTEEFSSGQRDNSTKFAEEVANDPRLQPVLVEDRRLSVLRLGFPLVSGNSATAVLQVLQRPTANQSVREGYMLFLSETVETLSASQTFNVPAQTSYAIE